eukprot:scaffold267830_cov32-Tisochrysis_lutea.AAC.1
MARCDGAPLRYTLVPLPVYPRSHSGIPSSPFPFRYTLVPPPLYPRYPSGIVPQFAICSSMYPLATLPASGMSKKGRAK